MRNNDRMRPPIRRPVAYAALGCALTAAYFTVPAGSNVSHLLYELVALLGLAAVTLGRHRARGSSWTLILIGVALWVGGDSYWNGYRWVTGHEAPFPSIADVFYLVCYVPLTAGVLGFVLGGRPKVGDLIEGAIVGVGASLVIWFAVLEPVARVGSSPVLARVVSLAYPVADNLLLVVLIQLVISGGMRRPALRWLVGAFTLILLTDLVYARARVDASYSAGSWVDAGYLLFYVFLGCAALSPSLAELRPRPDESARAVSKLRIGTLGLALAIAPSLVASGMQDQSHIETGILGLGAGIISLLVLARLVLLLRQHEAVDRVRIRAQAELAEIAFRDPLTGLANRSALYTGVDAAVGEAEISGRALAILFIDLDGFKQVNDRYGHLDGDDVLREAARRFEAAVRDHDLVARHGGDEFVIVMGGLQTAEAMKLARSLARRIDNQFAQPFPIQDGELEIGASIGFSLYPTDGRSARELISAADQAMYANKRTAGTNPRQPSSLRRAATRSADGAEVAAREATNTRADTATIAAG
jgi:diguanylate cyclase (GGDEF)-like protein